MLKNCSDGYAMAWTVPYHYYSIRIIQKLQCSLGSIIPLFEIISLMTRPSIAYYYIFPVAFYMGPYMGLSVIWSATLSDVLNLFLKSLLHGDRPYWWARENADKYQHFTIKQYRGTCEVSPGTPSGHAFITSAIWTTLLLMWCNCEPRTCTKLSTKIISFIALVLICLSRIVIATHFPHQVLLGVALGIGMAHFVIYLELYKNPPISYFHMALFILLLGLLTKYLFPSIDLCSCWSSIKAKKYCNNFTWVKRNTSKPFYSYLKIASILAGTGLSMLIITAVKIGKVRFKCLICLKVLSSILSLIITSFIYFNLSKYQVEGPPGLSFIILKNMMIPLTVIVFIPLLLGTYED